MTGKPTAPGDAEDFLQAMASASHARLEQARAEIDVADIAQRAPNEPPAPALRLSGAGFDLIAEVKKRSPAAGQLAGGDTVRRWPRPSHYAAAGASRFRC